MKTYDPARRSTLRPRESRRRKIAIAATIGAVILLAALGWFYRNWPQEHAVDKFFTALQQQHYEVAYEFTSTIRLAATSRKIFSVHVARFLSRLGPGGEWA